MNLGKANLSRDCPSITDNTNLNVRLCVVYKIKNQHTWPILAQNGASKAS